ncbi:ABC-2 type transport system permease protein [Aureibacter tunicatorum]|uniref:ABC-2 type transport system permease protein n=2 Tax=Aureibacter tunicatorum TaxID=866807 RepID=A0AAE3XLZ3_9BACT|nr:ABC-2 type transport system permease protein [Aureibacter tunicatorum]
MATILGNGLITNLPIGVIDQDYSFSSRNIIRNVNSNPSLNIICKLNSIKEAKKALQEKRIYGFFIIPKNFEKNASAFKPTTIPYYFHYALLTAGSTVYSELTKTLRTISFAPSLTKGLALGLDAKSIEFSILPIKPIIHPMSNPSLSYFTYLSSSFVYILIQILIILVTIYCFGTEWSKRTTGALWHLSKHSTLSLIIGKLLPYTIIFFTVYVIANSVFLLAIKPSLAASTIIHMNIACFLLVISTQSLGMFIFFIVRNFRIAMSIGSILGSLGASLAGITFPVNSMYEPVQILAKALPVRHFTLIMQNVIYGNNHAEFVFTEYIILFSYTVLPLLALNIVRKHLNVKPHAQTNEI